MALDFVAGCIGGCAGIIAGHPLDTLKVHIQSGRGTPLECTKALFRNGAIATAYRGVGAPLGGIAGLNAIVFGAYGHTRRLLPNPDSISSHALAGGIAGLFQSTICAPVELVKTRQQLCRAADPIPNGALAGARYVLRSGGFRALFRGLGVTMLRDSPAFAAYFAVYEAMTREDKSAAKVFTAGGLAGTVSWILVYPLDVVKSRMQGDIIGKYSSSWDCFVRSIRSDGWRCMGRGMVAVTVRAFISNGACFSAVVWTERAWQHCSSQMTLHTLVQAAAVIADTGQEKTERSFDV